MANYTPNYNLIIPQVTDNVNASTIPGIGNSNTTIDTQIKSLHDEDALLQLEITNNYNSLQMEISNNYTVLDTKIDTQVDILNNRIDNLILNSSPLPAVAAQEVMDSRFSPVYNITYTVLTDRITHAEQEIVDTQADVVVLQQDIIDVTIAVQEFVENYAATIRLGGIA